MYGELQVSSACTATVNPMQAIASAAIARKTLLWSMASSQNQAGRAARSARRAKPFMLRLIGPKKNALHQCNEAVAEARSRLEQRLGLLVTCSDKRITVARVIGSPLRRVRNAAPCRTGE